MEIRMSNNKTQLAVIGAGPGGYAAAFRAADIGIDTALIDPEEHPGGVCLYRGCIPTKALLHAVKLKEEMKNAQTMGISFSESSLDLDTLRDWKDSVVHKLTSGLSKLSKSRNIEYYQRYASFSDKNTLLLKNEEGEQTDELSFENAIIATGSYPLVIPGMPADSSRVMTSESALQIPDIPERLLVIGAGYIGLEMSTIYHGLGSKVSIAEMLDGLMPGADRDIIKEFQKANDGLFEEIMLSTKVKQAEETESGISVTFEGGENGAEKKEYDKVLLSLGRKPATEGLNLKNAGIETDEKGFITVDLQRRTNVENIYAVGDLTGPPLLAHKASHEGIAAVRVINGEHAAFDPKVIPSVEYTKPEIAWCGMNEAEIQNQEKHIRTVRFPWSASGRAATMATQHGMTKLFIDEDTEQVLGAAIVGENAGELIGETALAVEMAARASDIEMTIHPHPSLSETIMEAAASFYGTATTIYRPRRKQK
jgi:dihydrolipoamide dehydrogenase